MLKVITYQFLEGPYIECDFHWKLAIRRKLIERHIPLEIISQLMSTEGPINVHTVIPIEDIILKGIPYVISKTNKVGYEVNFNKFWTNFVAT